MGYPAFDRVINISGQCTIRIGGGGNIHGFSYLGLSRPFGLLRLSVLICLEYITNKKPPWQAA